MFKGSATPVDPPVVLGYFWYLGDRAFVYLGICVLGYLGILNIWVVRYLSNLVFGHLGLLGSLVIL